MKTVNSYVLKCECPDGSGELEFSDWDDGQLCVAVKADGYSSWKEVIVKAEDVMKLLKKITKR